jgi:putative IMPACT (imprinted ancient) family translation regulator
LVTAITIKEDVSMKTDFTYQLIEDGSITNVIVQPHPDWDEFDKFVDMFINNEGASLIAQDLGMDRHQVRYKKGEHQYILQFEHYSNSVWIETDF